MSNEHLPKSAMDRFHDHLDICAQCRKHPFGLCKVGEAILLEAGREDAIDGAHRILGLEPPR